MKEHINNVVSQFDISEKEKSFWNIGTLGLFGIYLIISSFFVYGIFETPVDLPVRIQFLIAGFLFLVGFPIYIIFQSFGERCICCHRPVRNFQRRVYIYWKEKTVPSGMEVKFKNVVHKKCHEGVLPLRLCRASIDTLKSL